MVKFRTIFDSVRAYRAVGMGRLRNAHSPSPSPNASKRVAFGRLDLGAPAREGEAGASVEERAVVEATKKVQAHSRQRAGDMQQSGGLGGSGLSLGGFLSPLKYELL